MKNKIISTLLFLTIAFMSANALADAANASSLDISNLTPEQKTALMQTAAQMHGNISTSEHIRTEAEKWAELGSNLGKATVSAAKEIGVAANEFVATPIGKITMTAIVFKIVGRDIIKLVIGLMILIVFISTAIIMLFKKKYYNAEFEYKPVLWGLYQKKYITSFQNDSDLFVAHLIIALISTVIGLFVGLNVMF